MQNGTITTTTKKNKVKYSGIPISRTSEGNKNWFEKLGVQNIRGEIIVAQIQRKRLLALIISGLLGNPGFDATDETDLCKTKTTSYIFEE